MSAERTMEKTDCIYPDCQIKGEWSGRACEHSCPFEREQKDEKLDLNRKHGHGSQFGP